MTAPKAGNFLFRARKRRERRFGKYNGLPATILYTGPDGLHLVDCGTQRFNVYPDELIQIAKPIHGSPQNYRFDNDGSLSSRGSDQPNE